MGGTYSTQGNMRNAYKLLDESPAGKNPLCRHRRRWEDNIKTDIKEIRDVAVD
jgi:hypothetical protein